jgi:GH35 family endo-1,4-beta-xylanase
MKKNLLLLVLCLFLMQCKLTSQTKSGAPKCDNVILKGLANTKNNSNFKIGVFYSSQNETPQEKKFIDQLATEMDRTVIYFGMYDIVKKDPSGRIYYDFTVPDAQVNDAINKKLEINFDCVFYPLSNTTTGEAIPRICPDFVVNYPNATQKDKNEFKKIVLDYIAAVLKRYAGKVKSHMITNEIFQEDKAENTWLRKRFDSDAALYEFIGECYKAAHKADPKAVLFFQDYKQEELPTKGNTIKTQLMKWLKNGVPIHGYALQFHVYAGMTKEAMKQALDLAVSTGLLIFMSELDVRINPGDDQYITTPTAAQLQNQRVTFRQAVEAYKESVPKSKQFGINMWDSTDKYTWFVSSGQRTNTGFEAPTMYDQDNQRKPAYYGFAEGLSGNDYSECVNEYITKMKK